MSPRAPTLEAVRTALIPALDACGFRPHGTDACPHGWRRRTWNTNRVAVLLEAPPGVDPAPWVVEQRAALAPTFAVEETPTRVKRVAGPGLWLLAAITSLRLLAFSLD